MGQDDELGGAALSRSAPRRDTTSGRGVGPARPQEDPVELAHFRAGRREVTGGEVVLHINRRRRPGEGLRALLAQVAEQDLLRIDVVREGRGRHGRRFELLAVRGEDPEGLIDYTVPLTEDPDLRVMTYTSTGEGLTTEDGATSRRRGREASTRIARPAAARSGSGARAA